MGMELSLANNDTFPDAGEDEIRRAFADESDFGPYAILSPSDEEFLQVAEAQWATRETDDVGAWCQDYEAKTGHLPRNARRPAWYVLEYRDPEQDAVFIATRVLSRSEVCEAVLDYIRGGTKWRRGRSWEHLAD
ncbi:MAG TPA: hypothetical protein VL475_13225 [Planctomycetaceae bacterium]|nr:hypothetical protein [Planctomycetaceae bacterium]